MLHNILNTPGFGGAKVIDFEINDSVRIKQFRKIPGCGQRLYFSAKMNTRSKPDESSRRFSYQRLWLKIAIFDLVTAAGMLVYVNVFAQPFPLHGMFGLLVTLSVLYSLLRMAWQAVLTLIYLWRQRWGMALLSALHGVAWMCVYQLIGYTDFMKFSTGVG